MIPSTRPMIVHSAAGRTPLPLWTDDPRRIDPLHDRWWLLWRKNAALREAVLGALARGWSGLIAGAIVRSGVGGATIKRTVLANLVGRHRSTLHRVERGEVPIHLDALYALSSLLGVEARLFQPSCVAEWVARITFTYCGGAVPEADSRLYAEYMWIKSERGQLPRVMRDPRVDREIVREVAARFDEKIGEDATRAAIERVALCLHVKLAHLKPGA